MKKPTIREVIEAACFTAVCGLIAFGYWHMVDECHGTLVRTLTGFQCATLLPPK